MEKKLYIGGLNYRTTVEGLQQAFGQAGQVVSAVIISDRMTGRSKGFGFVEMSNEADAAKAIELLNGKELEGRRLTVNEARPPQEKPRGGAGGPRRDFGGNRGGGGGGGYGGRGGSGGGGRSGGDSPSYAGGGDRYDY